MIGMLKKWRKIKEEESGASMVMVVLSLVIIFGFTAFAVDVGNAYNKKVQMQDMCDLSALAAASELPDKAKTERKAKEYAELNGFSGDEITVSLLEGDTQVEVKMAQDVNTFFAGVIGVSKVPVKCKAIASAGGGGAKDYAIFSGNEAYFGLHGNVNIPVGDIHANGNADITGTLNIKDGVIEVPKFNNQGSSGDYETYVNPENKIDMPDYTDIINKRLPNISEDGYIVINNGNFVDAEYVRSHTSGGVLTIPESDKVWFKGYLSIDHGIDKIVIKGVLKVEQGADFYVSTVVDGHLRVNDTINFEKETEISGTIIAGQTINFSDKVRLNEATIVFDGNQMNFQKATVTDKYSDAGYSVFWGRGISTHININANIDSKAMFYSPNGETIMSGGNVNIKGSITANQVGTHNGDLTVSLPKGDDKWEFGGRTGAGKKKSPAKLVG